jgi:undecaprenyl-diphosphatase
MGVGWVVVNEGFLRREGIDEGAARAATGLNMALTVASHVGLLLLALPLLPTLHLPTITPPQRRIFVDAAVAVAVILAVVLWIPWTRSRVLDVVRPALRAVPAVLGDPARSVRMVGGAVATNLAYAIALYGAIAAFGPAPAPLAVLVVYLLAATVAAIAPTPGGLGAMETALVAALTRVAVPGGQAVAATLAFRLASFWLPLAIGSVVLRVARHREWV